MKFYEHHTAPPIGSWKFLKRALVHCAIGAGIVALVFLIGINGFEKSGLEAPDARVEAAMLMTGIDRFDKNLKMTESGKNFASVYVIFCRFGLAAALAIPIFPFLHRLLHTTFHVRCKDEPPIN
jgi:hypothetical protein